MNCEAVKHLFSDYLDRSLPGELRESMDRHLLRCPACHRELGRLGDTVKALNRLPELPAPPDFLITLRERIDRTPAWKQWLLGWFPSASPAALRTASAAAGFLLIFSVAFVTGRQYQAAMPGEDTHLAFEVEKDRPAQWGIGPADPLAAADHLAKAERVPARPVSTGFRAPDALEVEYTATRSAQPPAFPFATPSELVAALVKADPNLRHADLYPVPQGVLALTPEYLYTITISPEFFSHASRQFARSGYVLPRSLGHAQRLYGLELRRGPSPLSPP